MNNPNTKNILKAVLSQFSRETGGKAKELASGYQGADAVIEIQTGKEKYVFWVEIKHELRQAAMPFILAKIGKQKDRWLLVSKYIPQPMKDQLKDQGINYAEVSGNCFINAGGLFIYINEHSVTTYRRAPTSKLWKAAGLKFLFAILSDLELLNAPYRKIAEAANIALGNIGPLLEELQAQYVKKVNGQKVLINKDKLIQLWTELYPIALKPTLQVGSFRFLKPAFRQEWKTVHPDTFLWGGEPAGDLYTNFLEPELFVIYSNNQVNDIIKEIQLVPDPAGEVRIIDQFWNKTKSGKVPYTVPPLLAYADLLDTSDSRNWEVAARIKSKYLDD